MLETNPLFKGMIATQLLILHSRQRAADLVTGWEVMDEETLSLHNYIRYEVRFSIKPPRPEGYGKGIFSSDSFCEAVRGDPTFDEIIGNIEDFVYLLRRAQDKATLQTRSNLQNRNAYWLTDAIQAQRSRTLAARRRYTRARTQNRMMDGDIRNLRTPESKASQISGESSATSWSCTYGEMATR